MTLNERFLGGNPVFVSFHFNLCIFCFVLVLTSMHHEPLVEVLEKVWGWKELQVFFVVHSAQNLKIVNYNSRLSERGVAQSEN